jgi:peptidoglycan lytic transglycosylase B
MRIAIVVGVVGAFLYAYYGSAVADYTARPDVDAYLTELAKEHGFKREALVELFKDAEHKQSIIDAISRPAEKVKPWSEYREIFLTDTRINEGVAFWHANAAALARAHKQYAVPPEVVVAIIGVETRYGRNAGSYRVLDALTTLAFDYPPRSGFFKSELTQLLLLAREEGVDPRSLTGSYAGAMGYGQFIPSSFRAYAVDFDGDGRRDIWSNPTDAIGSVANYFRRHGWTADGQVVEPASVTTAQADAVANESLNLLYTVGQLRALGATVAGVPDAAEAGLYRLDGAAGPEYWIGLHNFYVITRYNRSTMYALAVHQLGQAIAERGGAGTASAGSSPRGCVRSRRSSHRVRLSGTVAGRVCDTDTHVGAKRQCPEQSTNESGESARSAAARRTAQQVR